LLIEVLSLDNYNIYRNIFDKIFTNRTHDYLNTIPLGFSADPLLLKPNQNNSFIRILIDHPAYSKQHFSKKDKTKFILDNIFNNKFFDILHKKFPNRNLLVRRFINNNIET